VALKVGGKTIETDEEGYLENRDEWNMDIANAIAATENLEMSDSHWEAVNFLREYYEEYQTAPAIRVLIKPSAKNWAKTKATANTCMNCFLMARPSRPAKLPVCPNQQAVFNLPGLITNTAILA